MVSNTVTVATFAINHHFIFITSIICLIHRNLCCCKAMKDPSPVSSTTDKEICSFQLPRIRNQQCGIQTMGRDLGHTMDTEGQCGVWMSTVSKHLYITEPDDGFSKSFILMTFVSR